MPSKSLNKEKRLLIFLYTENLDISVKKIFLIIIKYWKMCKL